MIGVSFPTIRTLFAFPEPKLVQSRYQDMAKNHAPRPTPVAAPQTLPRDAGQPVPVMN